MGLVIGRRVGEVVHIGDDVRVEVAKLESGQVKLNITAPREIVVLRGELVGRESHARGSCGPRSKVRCPACGQVSIWPQNAVLNKRCGFCRRFVLHVVVERAA